VSCANSWTLFRSMCSFWTSRARFLQANRTMLDYKGYTLEEMKASVLASESTETCIPTIWRESRANDVLAF